MLLHAHASALSGHRLTWRCRQEGHKVTLLTRGKKPVTFQIPDDTDASYKEFHSAVQHIAADRSDPSAISSALAGKNFDGAPISSKLSAAACAWRRHM